MNGIVSDDEQALRKLVLAEGYGTEANTMPRYLAQRLGIPEKRADYLFGKWADKGWYDWGTCVDGGWLTDEGKSAFNL